MWRDTERWFGWLGYTLNRYAWNCVAFVEDPWNQLEICCPEDNAFLFEGKDAIPLVIGKRVVTEDGKKGIVRYMGSLGSSPGEWVGIELDEPEGLNDGVAQGVRYFTCAPMHGIFVLQGSEFHCRIDEEYYTRSLECENDEELKQADDDEKPRFAQRISVFGERVIRSGSKLSSSMGKALNSWAVGPFTRTVDKYVVDPLKVCVDDRFVALCPDSLVPYHSTTYSFLKFSYPYFTLCYPVLALNS